LFGKIGKELRKNLRRFLRHPPSNEDRSRC